MHATAGRLYAGPGIFDGFDRPPVICLASFINIIYSFLNLIISHSLDPVKLEAWRLRLYGRAHPKKIEPGGIAAAWSIS